MDATTPQKDSLDAFFYEKAKANLDNCDKEPIHYIGSVQASGAVVIVDKLTQQVVAASKNVPELLEVVPPSQPPYSLSEVFPEIAEELGELEGELEASRYTLLQHSQICTQQRFQVAHHEHQGYSYIEFLPEGNLDVNKFRQKLRLLRQSCSRIMDAPSFEEALDIAAEAARKITGFARAKIYEFQADWSGKVVAEAKADHMPSFKGMFFPDTDIPKQARHLMAMVPYRALATSEDAVSPIEPAFSPATGKPFDLSWSLLRSSSQMHTKYLRNMGVEGTFTCSLISRGKLWGLFACHHDKPKTIAFDLWGAMHDLAINLMAKLDQVKAQSNERIMKNLRDIEAHVANVIRSKGELEASIASVMPEIRKFLRSDGFAFQYGEKIHLEGKTPPQEFVQELLEWAVGKTSGVDSYATHSLQSVWDEAAEHRDTACGVLIEPVRLHRVCHLIWFRGPITQTAHWAGDPTQKKLKREADGTHTLQPRNSFATWEYEHSNESVPWSDAEMNAAREILKNMLDIIVTSQIQLSQNNKNLETFSYAAAHDLKAPLRSIQTALEIIQHIKDPSDVEEMRELIEAASGSSARLQNLITGMMNFLVLENRPSHLESVDVEAVIKQVATSLKMEIEQAGGSISIDPLPMAAGDHDLFFTLFLNLVGNAIKYRHPERPLEIQVTGKKHANVVEIAIEDNGLGIPVEYSERVFEPLNRLHAYDDIPGNGLGLSICRRITELLYGTIEVDPTYRSGARIVVRFRD